MANLSTRDKPRMPKWERNEISSKAEREKTALTQSLLATERDAKRLIMTLVGPNQRGVETLIRDGTLSREESNLLKELLIKLGNATFRKADSLQDGQLTKLRTEKIMKKS